MAWIAQYLTPRADIITSRAALGSPQRPTRSASLTPRRSRRWEKLNSRETNPKRWRSTKMLSRSEEHTSELQSHLNLVCRLLLEKKKTDQVYFPFCTPVPTP